MTITVDGSGTISGISVGGLPDAIITPAELTQPFSMDSVAITTSGTYVDFTAVPSWAKRVTILFNEVSTNGTSGVLIQLGTSVGVQNTGYVSTGVSIVSTTANNTSSTAGFIIRSTSSTNLLSGRYTLYRLSPTSNIWVGDGVFKALTNTTCISGGSKDVGAQLTQVRITTVNGTDAFDSGSVNLMYE